MDFYNQTVLPPRWARTALGELVEFTYGKALKEDRRDAGGKVPVYGSNGVVGTHSEALVSQPAVIIGRKGAAGEVHISHVPFWPIDTTYYAIPPDGLCLEFLYYVLKTLSLGSLDRSTAIPGLNRDDAYASEVSVPPFFEQRRIVAKIEELFSKLDAGVEELEKAKAQLKRYRQSVLKAAFSGELTGDWRKKRLATSKEPPETAQELLERIREERKRLATSEGRKWKEPPTLDTSELPELPEGWAWARMDAVNHRIQDGTHFSPTEQFDSPGDDRYPYVTSKNIRDWGMELDDITYVSEGTHRPIYDRCNPELGDVLLVKDGVNTGTVTTNTLDGEFSLLSSVALLKPIRHGLNPDYLRYYLASPIGQRMIAGSPARRFAVSFSTGFGRPRCA